MCQAYISTAILMVKTYNCLLLFCLPQDIEKLEHESKKVFHALRYVQDVVDKNMLQMLPGSATIALETVMEVNQLLNNYFIDQER